MKKIFLVLLAIFVAVSAFAAPAYRKPFTIKQSDGTELTVVLAGDEALHYFATADGMPLVKEANGDFCYATFEGGAFVSTKQLAHNSTKRSVAEKCNAFGNRFQYDGNRYCESKQRTFNDL